MRIPTTIAKFWSEFTTSAGSDVTARFYEAFHFDDNEPTANELAELVLRGTKRATAAPLWSFEAKGKDPPRSGALSVVTDWQGRALCVIETITVEIVAFDQIDAEFAATEGEGDGSLDYWRDAHIRFFTRECGRIGRTFSPDMPVVCERFKVVYTASRQHAA
jgi:uncharacterized protein YhfF